MVSAKLPPLERVRRWRRVEYDRLVETGFLVDEKVELIDGLIVRMSPQGPAHASAVEKLNETLVLALRGRARVRPQLPLALGEDSEPEPDLAVVAGDTPRDVHPSQALLVIEVADSSLTSDRRQKGALYARAGVPEYWIVDLTRRAVEVYREPVDDRYTRVVTFASDQVITARGLPDLALPVADLFA